MTISNSFLVRIVADTELGRTAAATAAGSFSAAMSVPSLATPIARLDPFNPDGTDYPDCVGGTTTNGYSMTRAWIWASKAMFDTTTRRVLFVNSPHPFDAFGTPNGNYNGYITLLTAYDEADNDIHVYESPFSYNNATWPRTVGHAFDNQCLVDRTLYKMTTPLWISGTGWVQPQLAKIDIDQVTDSVASAREGEAYLGSLNAPWEWDESALTWRNPGRNLTAGALDYLPGSDSLVFFHKKWLSFCPISTGTWTQPIDLEAQGYGFSGTYVAELGRTTWPIHNIGHYNAASGKFVCGGGAYNPDGASNHRYQLDWISVDATTQAITKLDDSPVIMSVSETDMPTTEPAHLREAKVAACAGPNSVESLFFHDNGNVYGLNPFRPPGYQWRVVTTLAFEVDLCVPIDDYGVVLLFTSGANGTASMRVYKPPVAGDHTPPSIPLDVAATATSSSEITVTWSASTDPVIQGDATSGVAGYRVYRNGTLVTPGPVGLVTTFDDTGLSAGTAYSYTVSAYDVAGNESEVSVADSATTEQAAGSYVATHYVAPFAQVPGATSDYDIQTQAAFNGAADNGSGAPLVAPCTIGAAAYWATGDNKVRCAPGVYILPDLGDNNLRSLLVRGGTSGHPVVLFAQNPASDNYGNSAAYSELRRPTVNFPTNHSSLVGSNGYAVIDGFYASEALAPSAPSAGMFCVTNTDVEYRRCVVDRDEGAVAYPSGWNNNPFYFRETSYNGALRDCMVIGNSPNGGANHNRSSVETYSAVNATIEHCTITGADSAIYFKTNGSGTSTNPDTVATCRYNRVFANELGITYQRNAALTIHNNLVVVNKATVSNRMALGYDVSAVIISTQFSIYNNTLVLRGPGANEEPYTSGIGFEVGALFSGVLHDNLVSIESGTGEFSMVSLPSLSGSDLSAFSLFDRNHYYRSSGTPEWHRNGMDYGSLTDWKNAVLSLGVEQGSTYGTVTFVDSAGGNYRLQTGSGGLTGVGGRTTTAGCYITGTEEIGVRANPSY